MEILPNRIVLPGCGGFVGSHLAAALLARGCHVSGWDLDDHRLQGIRSPDFEFHRTDLLAEDLSRLTQDADVVVNLAALCQPAQYVTRPLETIDDNYWLSRRIAFACAETKTRLVQFSTSEVYGRTLASHGADRGEDSWLLREDSTPLVLGPAHIHRWSYACSKQLVERTLFALALERGLEFTIVRPFNFLGPWMDFLPGRDGEGTPRVLASFVGAMLDQRPLPLVDGGRNRRTFCSIHDAVDGILKIMERPEASRNQVFNLGHPGNETTMEGFAQRLRQAFVDCTGNSAWLSHPTTSVSSLDFYGPGYEDSDRRVPCIAKARERLDWEPRTPLDEILRETVVDFLSRHSATQFVNPSRINR